MLEAGLEAGHVCSHRLVPYRLGASGLPRCTNRLATNVKSCASHADDDSPALHLHAYALQRHDCVSKLSTHLSPAWSSQSLSPVPNTTWIVCSFQNCSTDNKEHCTLCKHATQPKCLSEQTYAPKQLEKQLLMTRCHELVAFTAQSNVTRPIPVRIEVIASHQPTTVLGGKACNCMNLKGFRPTCLNVKWDMRGHPSLLSLVITLPYYFHLIV